MRSEKLSLLCTFVLVFAMGFFACVQAGAQDSSLRSVLEASRIVRQPDGR